MKWQPQKLNTKPIFILPKNTNIKPTFNPRPAGVWLVTHPAGGGGGKGPPWELPNYWTDFQISSAIR